MSSARKRVGRPRKTPSNVINQPAIHRFFVPAGDDIPRAVAGGSKKQDEVGEEILEGSETERQNELMEVFDSDTERQEEESKELLESGSDESSDIEYRCYFKRKRIVFSDSVCTS